MRATRLVNLMAILLYEPMLMIPALNAAHVGPVRAGLGGKKFLRDSVLRPDGDTPVRKIEPSSLEVEPFVCETSTAYAKKEPGC